MGKPYISGHFPLFFFFEPIRIYAGKGSKKAGLAMIHMTGCGESEM